MHLGGRLEYQFAAACSREMMSDFVRVSSSSPVGAMTAS
jgi:hypothetical protein